MRKSLCKFLSLFIKNEWFLFFVVFLSVLFIIFKPFFLNGKIPFSSNLLVSFYNPWAQESFRGWGNGIPNKPVGIDDLRIFYPQRSFTTQMLKSGQIPFWNPYSFSGNYHLGLSETGVFYPLSFIFLFLPQILSWEILVLIQPLIIGFGMYLYLRLVVKEKFAALFGAIVLAFSGLVIVRMVEGISVGHALIWFPYVLYGIESFIRKIKSRYLFLILLALSSSLLSGWFQFTFYIFIFSFFYSFFRIIYFEKDWKSNKQRFLVFVPLLLFPLVTLFHIFPSIQALEDSPRSLNSAGTLGKHLMPIQHLLTLVFPDLWGNPGSYNFFGRSEYKESILYFGMIPLIFALFSLFNLKKNPLIKLFSLSVLITLILGTDNILSRFILSISIPIVSSFLPNRIFMIAVFCFSALSALGLEYFIENYGKIGFKKIVKVLFFVFVFIAITNFYLALVFLTKYLLSRPNLSLKEIHYLKNLIIVLSGFGLASENAQFLIQLRNTFIPNLIFIVTVILFLFKLRIRKTVFFILVFAITIVSQLYFAQKYMAFSEPSFVFPDNPVFSAIKNIQNQDRFISIGEGYIPANFSMYFRLYSPDGVASMYPKTYGELVSYYQTKGRGGRVVPRVESRIEPQSKDLLLGKDLYLQRFMQVSGIKYIVKLKQEKDTGGLSFKSTDMFPLVWENSKWQIFEYRNSLPRFFWTNNFEIIEDQRKNLAKVYDFRNDPKKIILDSSPNINVSRDTKGEVALKSYSPNEIDFITKSSGDGLLYLSDNYSSQFKALVDGRDSPILKANHTFRAVAIKAGIHKVKLYFDNSSFNVGLGISACVFFIFTISCLLLDRKKTLYF